MWRDYHAARFVHRLHTPLKGTQHRELFSYKKSQQVSLARGYFVTGYHFETIFAAFDQLKRLQRTARVVVVGDSDNVEYGVIFNEVETLLYDCQAVAQRSVDVQVCCADTH